MSRGHRGAPQGGNASRLKESVGLRAVDWIRAGEERIPARQGTVVCQQEPHHQATHHPEKPLPCVAGDIGKTIKLVVQCKD
jgi:hypothetical protein